MISPPLDVINQNTPSNLFPILKEHVTKCRILFTTCRYILHEVCLAYFITESNALYSKCERTQQTW